MTNIINCTPHAINVNGMVFDPSGIIPRVSSEHEAVATLNSWNNWDDSGATIGFDVFENVYGDIVCLPDPEAGVVYIFSAMVLTVVKAAGRTDCVAPATGHPDVVRNDKGHIVSVPGFVK